MTCKGNCYNAPGDPEHCRQVCGEHNDDLLAEADRWRGSLLSEDLVRRLASALRQQSEEVAYQNRERRAAWGRIERLAQTKSKWISIAGERRRDIQELKRENERWRESYNRVLAQSRTRSQSLERLESELTKASEDIKQLERLAGKLEDDRDRWEQIAADHRQGVAGVTDDRLDRWIETLRSGKAVVFGPPQAQGLADRLEAAKQTPFDRIKTALGDLRTSYIEARDLFLDLLPEESDDGS